MISAQYLSWCLLAQTADGDSLGMGLLLRHLIAVVVFSVVGVMVLFCCVWIFDKLSPYSFRKEILEDQNTALAIIAGAVLIGIAMIISAAMTG